MSIFNLVFRVSGWKYYQFVNFFQINALHWYTNSYVIPLTVIQTFRLLFFTMATCYKIIKLIKFKKNTCVFLLNVDQYQKQLKVLYIFIFGSAIFGHIKQILQKRLFCRHLKLSVSNIF